MVKRCWLLVVLFSLFGIAMALRPSPKVIVRTEKWLEDSTPLQVGAYNAIPGPDGSTQTYRMDDETYKILQPFGIVCRTYDNGHDKYDTVAVAGNTRDCFHNPEHCFPSQNWKILDRQPATIETSKYGRIPATLLRVQSDGPAIWALFTFKGPRGFVDSQGDLYLQWSVTNFLTGEPQEGAFFRFMTVGSELSSQQLEQFAGSYLSLVKFPSSP